jgi:hypothetical protein
VPLTAMPLSSGWPRILRSASAEGSAARISDRCGPSSVHGLHRQFARHCLANLPSSQFSGHYQENPRLEPRAGDRCTKPMACPRWRRHFRCRAQPTCDCYRLGTNSRASSMRPKPFDADGQHANSSDRSTANSTNAPRYARQHWAKPGENPPVGLIICATKGVAEAHYALEGLPNKVLAAEYRTVLPDEKLLAEELVRTRRQVGVRPLPGDLP